MKNTNGHAVGKEITMRSRLVRNASVVSCRVIDHLGNGLSTTKERRRSSSTAAACVKTEWSEDGWKTGKWSGGLKLSTTSQSQSCVRSCSWQIVLHSRAVMCIVVRSIFWSDVLISLHCRILMAGRSREKASKRQWPQLIGLSFTASGLS